jgi:hypothetical protein
MQLAHVSSPISYRPNQTATATGFVALVLPILSTHRTVSRLYSRVSHPFREPLQFIVIAVMSVIGGTFPDTYGVSCMTVNCGVSSPSCHRHGEEGFASDFLATMTVMTLVTLFYGRFLDGGGDHVLHDRWIS